MPPYLAASRKNNEFKRRAKVFGRPDASFKHFGILLGLLDHIRRELVSCKKAQISFLIVALCWQTALTVEEDVSDRVHVGHCIFQTRFEVILSPLQQVNSRDDIQLEIRRPPSHGRRQRTVCQSRDIRKEACVRVFGKKLIDNSPSSYTRGT